MSISQRSAALALAVVLACACSMPAQAQDAPTLTILEPAGGAVFQTGNVPFVFESDGVSFRCKRNSVPFDCAPGSTTLFGLSDGFHFIEVEAFNAAGFSTMAITGFHVDTRVPSIDIQSPAEGARVPVPFPILFTSDEPDASFVCTLDGQAFPCRPDEMVEFILPHGFHALQISATDRAGNSRVSNSFFFVDLLGPVFDPAFTTIPAAPACSRSTPDTEISWRAAEQGAEPPGSPYSFSCSLNGSPAPGCITTQPNLGFGVFRWKCLADGQHRLEVVAHDSFGNPSEPLVIDFAVERAANACPVDACAGPDQVRNQGDTAMLDGSLSVGAEFSWSQIGGPPVTFPDEIQTSFAVPRLAVGTASQVLTFRLDARRADELDSDTVNVSVNNRAPVADAGADQSVKEGSMVTLSAAASYDPDGSELSAYHWTQTEGMPVQLSSASAVQPTFVAPTLAGGVGSAEVLTFRLTVSDGTSTSQGDEVRVVVEQMNHAPLADAGADQTKVEGSLVTLDAGASRDPDGDALIYAWTQILGQPVTLANASGATPTFTAPAVPAGGDTLVFKLSASDGALQSTDEVAVRVTQLNDPPVCTAARASRSYLWPPNHKLVPVTIVGVADPDNAQLNITITGVTQDEPVNGTGDGDSAPDAVIQGAAVLLRAERAGNGNGRVYQVSFTADDGRGGVCSGAVPVVVPITSRPGGVSHDGPLFDSTGQ